MRGYVYETPSYQLSVAQLKWFDRRRHQIKRHRTIWQGRRVVTSRSTEYSLKRHCIRQSGLQLYDIRITFLENFSKGPKVARDKEAAEYKCSL